MSGAGEGDFAGARVEDSVDHGDEFAHGEVFDQGHLTFGVVHGPSEVVKDPQLRENDIVVPIEGARDLEYTVNNPITLRGLDRVPSRRAPEHGEHNDDVLAQLGFSATEIAQLREQKVIPVAAEQETVK